MAKIYDQNQKNEPGREFRPGQQEQAKKSGVTLVIGIILALLIIFMLYRMASGGEGNPTELIANIPIVSSFYVSDR